MYRCRHRGSSCAQPRRSALGLQKAALLGLGLIAMASQAAIEGRFLGGRPPYGYQLVDADPHPNPGKAATGQRLHKLGPDATAAPIVVRIFQEYADGFGLKRIASGLKADGVPSPAAHDPGRNPYRANGHGKWARRRSGQ